MAGSEEDICAGCSLHPLEVSLVLICNHRLCLKCAHWQMHVSEAKGSKLFEAPSYTASCPSCGSATQVEAGAAQQILSMQSSPDIQPVPSSISPVERRTQRSVREGRWTAQSPDPEAIERVLPKPRSPLTSNLSNLPSSPEAELQRCGQCQVEAADVRCLQCDEFFCQTCYKRMHHMGRMKEHRYTTIATIPISKIANQRTPQTEFCIHHGEPIDFFCIDCTQCLCAECAVHRGGCVSNGHDVKNVRSAFNQLSGSMQQLLETATARLKKPSPKKDLTQQLDDVHSKGKQDLKTSFLNLEETLKAKEENLLKEAEESGRIADQSLLAKARQCEAKSVQINRLRQSIDGVCNPSSPDVTCTLEGSGNEILKINTYVAVKNSLASSLPQSASALDAFIHITFEYPFQTGCVHRVCSCATHAPFLVPCKVQPLSCELLNDCGELVSILMWFSQSMQIEETYDMPPNRRPRQRVFACFLHVLAIYIVDWFWPSTEPHVAYCCFAHTLFSDDFWMNLRTETTARECVVRVGEGLVSWCSGTWRSCQFQLAANAGCCESKDFRAWRLDKGFPRTHAWMKWNDIWKMVTGKQIEGG